MGENGEGGCVGAEGAKVGVVERGLGVLVEGGPETRVAGGGE